MAIQTYTLQANGWPDTVFTSDGQRLWLQRLFGLLCGNNGTDDGPQRTQGPVLLASSQGRFEGPDLVLQEAEPTLNGLRVVWMAGDLRLETRWVMDEPSGVLCRQDRLVNMGSEPITVTRCLARFAFPMGRYELYRQESRWCTENQGEWVPLVTGSLTLRHEWGRTTRGGTPYACLREVGTRQGTVFHVLPRGNWTIRAGLHGFMHNLPVMVMELGLSDEDLRLKLNPGEAADLPEVLVQPLPEGEPPAAAPALHDYVLRRFYPPRSSDIPVVYNTWFDRFDLLDVPRLKAQLAAAKEVGCEVFVVDAGWFSPDTPGWGGAVGDWREKTASAFHGKMAEFADEVRAAGLGFGLWMEPERCGPAAPVRREHPDWFIQADGDFARYDLENPAVYAWLRDEIARLVETYRLAWMKIDFNFELGYDPSGAELLRYYERWYQLLDEIRTRYPPTFFEGCSSGAMRLDLNALAHFNGHFLSDTVNPVDMLRITQGALLRLPPGQLTRWAVLRAVGRDVPAYGDPMETSWPVMLVAPGGAGWQPSISADLDFAVLAALPGIAGLSGDLAGLPDDVKARLRSWLEHYKAWRAFISHSIAYLLTPPRPLEDRTGWVAWQLQGQGADTSLVYAYRLSNARSREQLLLRGLNPERTYEVQRVHTDKTLRASGKALMTEGLTVDLIGEHGAAMFEVVAR